MDNGWIKLWRKTLDSQIFAHEGLLKLFILCLLKANREPADVTIPGILKPIHLEPGQFITGRESLWEDYHQLHLKKKPRRKPLPHAYSLFRWLLTLQDMQKLCIKTYNKYSIITVLNWNQYQENVQQVCNSCASTVHKQEDNSIYACEFFQINESQHNKYQDAYSLLDLMAEYRKMAAWLESNPQKRPKKNYTRFVNGWLSRSAEKKRNHGAEDWRSKLKPI